MPRAIGREECSHKGCTSRAVSDGLCFQHFSAQRTRADRDFSLVKRVHVYGRGECIVQGCDRLRYGHGYCEKHYNQWKRYGDIRDDRPKRPRTCALVGCDRPHRWNGYCTSHSQLFFQKRKTLRMKKFCSLPYCFRKHERKGLCRVHWKRMEKYGSVHLPPRPVDHYCTCERPKYARGLCRRCYERLVRQPRREGGTSSAEKNLGALRKKGVC